MSDKPRYPAKFFKRRHLYPARFCEVCGARLTPRLETKDRIETPRLFAERRTCASAACRSELASRNRRTTLERKRAAVARVEEPPAPKPQPRRHIYAPPPRHTEPPTPEQRAELLDMLKEACEQHLDLLEFLGTDNPLNRRVEELELGRARA